MTTSVLNDDGKELIAVIIDGETCSLDNFLHENRNDPDLDHWLEELVAGRTVQACHATEGITLTPVFSY